MPQRGDEAPIWDSNDVALSRDGTPSTKLKRPEERGCGLSTKSFPKITGGRPTDPNEWP